MTSEYLDNIISNQNKNQIHTFQIVVVDVKQYSKRRSQNQVKVVKAFMDALKKAKDIVSKQYLDFAQSNGRNFKTDIIVLPTGDGAAVGFPFGIHDIHLVFARQLLKTISEHNSIEQCEKFKDNGWCNCHPFFNVRVGIDEGKAILYKDLNENYNITGNVISMASRVMDCGDAGHILMTEGAYEQLVEMTEDPHLDDNFRKYEGVKIKHGLEIIIYQYANLNEPYINCAPPEDLDLNQRAQVVMDNLYESGFPIPTFNNDEYGKSELIELVENFGQLLSRMKKNKIREQ